MRDNTVSIAKGFAIVLMVLAHTCFCDTGDKWINMFHMPLFFFFAGYCFKDKYLTDFRTFAIKRITGLYKPYVKWSLFSSFSTIYSITSTSTMVNMVLEGESPNCTVLLFLRSEP